MERDANRDVVWRAVIAFGPRHPSVLLQPPSYRMGTAIGP